jgi:hypothetical protein
MNKKYTDEHIEFLRNNIVGTSFKDLTEMFNQQFDMNLSRAAIVSLTDRHGLHNEIDAKFNKGHEPTQFKKGTIPWNKGKKGFMGANKTSFKKGNRSHNWVPIGTERETKDGYIQVKVQDGKFQHNWKGKHIIIWEEHNRPVPKGSVIIFGDGDKTNFSIENLILVTRNQLKCLNRQNLIQKDADLTRAAITIVDLQNKIIDKGKKVEKQ